MLTWQMLSIQDWIKIMMGKFPCNFSRLEFFLTLSRKEFVATYIDTEAKLKEKKDEIMKTITDHKR
jgi:hypothetical protein